MSRYTERWWSRSTCLEKVSHPYHSVLPWVPERPRVQCFPVRPITRCITSSSAMDVSKKRSATKIEFTEKVSTALQMQRLLPFVPHESSLYSLLFAARMSANQWLVAVDDTDPAIKWDGPWFDVRGSTDDWGMHGPPFLRTLRGITTNGSFSLSFRGTSLDSRCGKSHHLSH